MVSWLHLSDFHFSKQGPKKWDERVVLKTLVDDIAHRVSEDDLRLDFILVSGDVAFGGSPEEYGSAAAFFDELLRVTGLTKQEMVIVPGNHDVSLGAVTFSENAITDRIIDRRALAQVMEAKEARRLILRRLDGFRDFVNSYLDGDAVFDDEQYFCFRRFDVRGKSVAVLGLNSASMARPRLLKTERLASTAKISTRYMPRCPSPASPRSCAYPSK
jgi:3',5'-cyclic AMP phosphodiesterase CpdA